MSFKLHLYVISQEYGLFLSQFDSKVPMIVKTKSSRPFLGIVLKIHDISYFAPLSSPKKKHLKIPDQVDFLKIQNGTLGAINFNNMIPVPDNQIFPVQLKIQPDDTESEQKYKILLSKQIEWCNSHRKEIFKNAKWLYQKISSGNASESLKMRCCNFPLLEEKMKLFPNEKGTQIQIK